MANLVSVIIPTYNRAAFARRAINSVLAQTYRPIEIIVVDDGSSDGIWSALAAYGDDIRLLRQPHEGASSARNKGLREAKGHFIAFLDSDDFWAPEKTAEQVRTLEKHPDCGICYTWYVIVNEEDRFLRAFAPMHEGDVFLPLYFNNFLVTPHIMLRRECVLEDDLLKTAFDTSLSYGEDWKLWLQLSLDWRTCFVPRFLVYVTDHGRRVYRTGTVERIIQDYASIEKSIFSTPRMADRLRPLGDSARVVWPMRTAYLWSLKRERLKALKGFMRIAMRYPCHWPAYTGIAQTITGMDAVDQLIRGLSAVRYSRLFHSIPHFSRDLPNEPRTD